MKKIIGLICLMFMLVSCGEDNIVDDSKILDDNIEVEIVEKNNIEIEEQKEAVEIKNIVEEKSTSGNINDEKKLLESNKKDIIIEKKDNFLLNETSNDIFFGGVKNGYYTLTNINSKKEYTFIPEGYFVADIHSYEPLSKYLILRKDNNVYSYNMSNGVINKIDINGEGKYINLYQSISEKEKFYISVISNFQNTGMLSYSFDNIEGYYYNASTNNLRKSDNLDFMNPNLCKTSKYDSKYNRFFVWGCGAEGGRLLPMKIYDVLKKDEKEIKIEGGGQSTSVEYNDGTFHIFFYEGQEISEIQIIKPREKIEKLSFKFSDNVILKLKGKIRLYSSLFIENKQLIILGGDDYILFLPYNLSNQIIDSIFLSETKTFYANFLFTDKEKLYYQTKDDIKVVNLNNYQIEKSLSKIDETTTIFSINKKENTNILNADNIGSDYNIINKYYGYLLKRDYGNAYNLKYNPTYNLDKFKDIYNDKYNTIKVKHIETLSENKYVFRVSLFIEGGGIEYYTVQMKIIDGKLETISSVKIEN